MKNPKSSYINELCKYVNDKVSHIVSNSEKYCLNEYSDYPFSKLECCSCPIFSEISGI